MYTDEGEDKIKSTRYGAKKHQDEPAIEPQNTGMASSSTSTAVAHRAEDDRDTESGSADPKEEEAKQPQMGVWVTVGLLTVVTVVSLLHFKLLLSCAEVYISWSQLLLSVW